MSEMKKLSAMRSGYLTSALKGCRPLARAVTTYCFCSSSSRLARSRRIMPAVPAVPMIMTGIHRCSRIDLTLAQLIGSPKILRIHQMADRRAEPDIGEIHQDQRQHEIRDGEAEQAEEGQPVVAPAVLVRRRIDADRKGDQPGEDDGDEGNEHGQPQPVADDVADRQLVFEGIAEIAVQHAGDPVEVADHRRLVETVFLAQHLDLLGGRRLRPAPAARRHSFRNSRRAAIR